MKTEEFNVPGVSCEHCVRAITDEVGTLEGVKQVQVDLQTKKVRVEATDQVSREQLVAAIDEAGYDVAPFDQSIPLS